jgi:hypothetical protein
VARDRVAEIVALAKEEHPYEVPGISTRTITGGNPDYLAWIAQETLGQPSTSPLHCGRYWTGTPDRNRQGSHGPDAVRGR